MTSWSYILVSIPWAAIGLLVGFFVGRSTVAVDAIADAVQEGDRMSESHPDGRSRFSGIHLIGLLVVALGIFTAVQSYVQGRATERLAMCQQAYSNGFADALDARSEATAAAQTALDDLLTTVASITPTPDGREKFRAALTEYLEKRGAAKKAQQEHPYPPAPRDVCD